MNYFMYFGHAQLAACIVASPPSAFSLDLLNSLGTTTRNVYYFPCKSETKEL